ncbi:unnamed protein product [Cochlearia groenlandica]
MGNILEEIDFKVRSAWRDMIFVEVVLSEAIKNGLVDEKFISATKSIIKDRNKLNIACQEIEYRLNVPNPHNTDSNLYFLRKAGDVVAKSKMLVVDVEKAAYNAKERREISGNFAKQSKNHKAKQIHARIDEISKIINSKACAAKTNVDNSKKAYTKAINSGLNDQEFKTATNQIMSQINQTSSAIQNVQDRLRNTDFLQTLDDIEKMVGGALEHSKTEFEQMRKAVSDGEERQKARGRTKTNK